MVPMFMATPDQAGAPGVGSLSSCPHPGTLLAPSGQHQQCRSLVSIYIQVMRAPGYDAIRELETICLMNSSTFRPKIDILLPHQYLYFQVYDPFGWLCWPGSRGYS